MGRTVVTVPSAQVMVTDATGTEAATATAGRHIGGGLGPGLLRCGREIGGDRCGAVSVVQGQEFPARAQSLVGELPEAPRLPQAPGLGVADGRNRHPGDRGELGLRQPGGTTAGREGSRQGTRGTSQRLLPGRRPARGNARPGTWTSTGDQHPFPDKSVQRLPAGQLRIPGRAGQRGTARRRLAGHEQSRRDLSPDARGDLPVLRRGHGCGQSSRNQAMRQLSSPSMPQLPSPAMAATTARPRPCSSSSCTGRPRAALVDDLYPGVVTGVERRPHGERPARMTGPAVRDGVSSQFGRQQLKRVDNRGPSGDLARSALTWRGWSTVPG